uniref:Radial spoke protein 3 n=1 Tax=Palpitomonas bilix TaxID=652834 RepID=A0A7S3LT27_9EUKA|mmetsp:Transcript_45117/g.116696  ORF Transcript_45117/g.116696 Transcript_45117/m.116696 type:complete len:367 (+) Transcript_45117:90-1190(+)
MANPAAKSSTYTFAAEPRAVGPGRKKYRDPYADSSTQNIMFDRRVVRGNTYSVQPSGEDGFGVSTMGSTGGSKGKTSRNALRTNSKTQIETPKAVEGRKHIDIQTESYLEELVDRPIEVDMTTQTDAFLDRPATPLYVPAKTGVDAFTQIEEGELFNFDYEVEPMLEVIVGKTLEQAMMEVLEEEELASLRAHQEEYEFIRQAELAEAQRMEEAERRKFEEKERRVAQEKKRVEEEEQVSEKVAARAFARHYVSDVLHGVFDNLQGEGYFYDPLVMEVKSDFMPWLRSAFEKKWSKMEIARKIADALIEGAVQRGAAQGTEEDEKRIQRENEEKARQAVSNVAGRIGTSLCLCRGLHVRGQKTREQ